MVGASEHLTDLVDGIVIDAEVGRPFADGIAALERQNVAIDPPDILVVALGTNAGTNAARVDQLVSAAGDVNEIILVNVRVPRGWESATNAALADAAARHDHVRIVDWYGESADGDHLFAPTGTTRTRQGPNAGPTSSSSRSRAESRSNPPVARRCAGHAKNRSTEVVEPGIGLEPMTFSLQERCSSN